MAFKIAEVIPARAIAPGKYHLSSAKHRSSSGNAWKTGEPPGVIDGFPVQTKLSLEAEPP
jgi:hypothetical protein